jgi:thiamine biosynthesis lipoprotein
MASQPVTSRRRFFTGQAAAEEPDGPDQSARETVSAPGDPASSADESYLLHFSRRAMACEFELTLNAGQYEAAASHALAALDLVQRLEDQMTVFRQHSQVMDINRRAAHEPVEVEPRLFALLEMCVALYHETGGAYDITAGPLTKVWGFYRRQGAVPAAQDLREARQRVGCDKIELDAVRRTIRFHVPGMEINLGSVGKGYALDRCGEALLAAGVSDFFSHGGQSSVLARGSRSSAAELRGWTVGIADPLRHGKRLGQVRLRDRGLGTSGGGTQFFRHRGRKYGHILDPRTGWPAERAISVTVLAPTAAQADALSTAFYVLGPERTREYCEQHREVAAFMVFSGPGGTSPQTTALGFADGELTVGDGP